MNRQENHHILVIKTGTRERFIRIFQQSDWLQQNDWLLWGENQRSDDTPYEIIWSTDDEETRVHYIQDHAIEIAYFFVEGQAYEDVAREVQAMLAHYVYTKEDIIGMWHQAQTQSEKINAMYHVGAASPSSFDEDYYHLFQQAFADPDPEVRLAGVWAASYVAWSNMQELIRTVQTDDENSEVRDTAASLLRTYDQHLGLGYE